MLDKNALDDKHRRQLKAFRYVSYHGHVVGFYHNGNGTFVPSYYGMSTAKIPKGKLLDLDNYCPGFTREQVKKLKATVLSLSG